MKCKDCAHWQAWASGHVGDCFVGGDRYIVIAGRKVIKSTCRNDECHIKEWQDMVWTEALGNKGWQWTTNKGWQWTTKTYGKKTMVFGWTD